VKAVTAQQGFDFIKNDPLEDMTSLILRAKESMNNAGQGIKSQGASLKETLDTLNEIHAVLSDMRQGELFDSSSIETVDDKDDIECKNEVFEELRELLGNEQAEKVADYFSGSLVYFSKNIAVARKYREIRKAFREGANYRELSAKYRYTETHIRNIVHKGGKNT
jgi:Mor family transcriptional regulator